MAYNYRPHSVAVHPRRELIMMCDWLQAPIGIDSSRWITRTGCRTVLIVAHTMVSCQRLLDVVDYVESDPRIQTVFTVPPDAFNRGVTAYLARLGTMLVPWHQAVRERFDLAVAAAYGGLHELHAPLMVMAHGAGHGKRVWTGGTHGVPLSTPPVYGLDAPRLVRDGRVLASALLLSHISQRAVLRDQCPEALSVATVVGDPCFDRLLASVSSRPEYRHSLGVADDQELVVVASTWGADGLFGSVPDLIPRLLDELLPLRYRLGVLLHPAVWAAHGERQVNAWLRDSVDAGLLLLEPTQDWRALVVAANRVVGDHGSVTAYAAAIGTPVLSLGPPRPGTIAPDTPQDLVTARAGRLDLSRPVAYQLQAARPVDSRAVAAALTSRPGLAGLLIRRAMYRMLGLAEPGRHRRPLPAPRPRPDSGWRA